MTAPVADAATTTGSYVTRKVGPLPVWAWLLLALGLVYAVVAYRKSKTTASSDTTDTATTPVDATPPQVFQDYVTITGAGVPPAGGRVTPPAGGAPTPPPAGGSSGSGTSGGSTTPTGGGSSATPSPKPAATTVTVAKYSKTNAPWNSTLSGIAKHEGYGSDWQAIWNAAANAALRTRRKTPDSIQPGDKIIVPAK